VTLSDSIYMELGEYRVCRGAGQECACKGTLHGENVLLDDCPAKAKASIRMPYSYQDSCSSILDTESHGIGGKALLQSAGLLLDEIECKAYGSLAKL
jgi:hypothetical protein